MTAPDAPFTDLRERTIDMRRCPHHPRELPQGRTRRWHHMAAALAVVSLLGAACGDDDDDTDASATTEPAETESSETTEAVDDTADSSDETDGDLAAFCQGAIDGEAMFVAGPALDAEGNPTPDGLEQFSADIGPAIDGMEENAPEEITDDVETLLAGVRTAIEEGDASITETQEFFEADAAVDAYVYDNCELDGTQEITAVDYGYEDLPETMTPGQVGIRMDNQGEEVHEAVLLRINDDVDLSVDELLELPEAEAEQSTEFRGVVFAPPGEQASAVVDLDEGRYVAICFIPVGTTSLEDAGPGGEGGPPHFTEGMFQPFEVG